MPQGMTSTTPCGMMVNSNKCLKFYAQRNHKPSALALKHQPRTTVHPYPTSERHPVNMKTYPCGCEAGPTESVPDYCPDHYSPKALRPFETETIDKLFLELSQFTMAKTRRELALQNACRLAHDWINGTSFDVKDNGDGTCIVDDASIEAAHVEGERIKNILSDALNR